MSPHSGSGPGERHSLPHPPRRAQLGLRVAAAISTHAPSPYTLMALTQFLAQPRLCREGQSSRKPRHWPVKLQPSKISRRKCSPCCGPAGGGRKHGRGRSCPSACTEALAGIAAGSGHPRAPGLGPVSAPTHTCPFLFLHTRFGWMKGVCYCKKLQSPRTGPMASVLNYRAEQARVPEGQWPLRPGPGALGTLLVLRPVSLIPPTPVLGHRS